MKLSLALAFLFFIGSVFGWVLEVIFRRFFSDANPERKWINPGFCTGPYVPLYGFGLCILFLIASLEGRHLTGRPLLDRAVLFVSMAAAMTAIEYIAGIAALKLLNLRLWDYSGEKFNIQGLICPKFSVFWALLGAAYYFLVHPRIMSALAWLSNNLAFSFFIGLFFGVFIIDAADSAQLAARLRRFAVENDVIVRFETIKSHIRRRIDERHEKYRFFRPFDGARRLGEHLRELAEEFEKRKK